MNKAKLCNIIRKYYPKAFGIRKALQRLKIKRLDNKLLSQDIIKK